MVDQSCRNDRRHTAMAGTTPEELRDNGGRRSGVDRRQFVYADYMPERRSGTERRSGRDRRKTYGHLYADENYPSQQELDP